MTNEEIDEEIEKIIDNYESTLTELELSEKLRTDKKLLALTAIALNTSYAVCLLAEIAKRLPEAKPKEGCE